MSAHRTEPEGSCRCANNCRHSLFFYLWQWSVVHPLGYYAFLCLNTCSSFDSSDLSHCGHHHPHHGSHPLQPCLTHQDSHCKAQALTAVTFSVLTSASTLQLYVLLAAGISLLFGSLGFGAGWWPCPYSGWLVMLLAVTLMFVLFSASGTSHTSRSLCQRL